MEMYLRIYSPTEVILDTPVNQVDFEAIDGFFTLLLGGVIFYFHFWCKNLYSEAKHILKGMFLK